MDLNSQTSDSSDGGEFIQQGLHSGKETAAEASIIVQGANDTSSREGIIIPDQPAKVINKNKPWRQIIKRRYIDGRSDD